MSLRSSTLSASPEPPVTRLSDFVCFFVLPFPFLVIAGLPVSELAMVGAVALAVSRGADPGRRLPAWVPPLLLLFLAWAVTVSLFHDLEPYRRLLHLLLFAALIVTIAQGRFAMQSVARGLALGMVVSGGAGLLGIGGGYAGRLTGYFGDPNAAGFYLLALGAVAAAFLPAGRQRTLLLGAAVVLITLTLSRTSILALVLGAAWVVAGRKLRPVPNLLLAVGLIYAVTRAANALRNWGPFASRAGSDELRARIVLLERLKIDASPWIGNGPGTSRVLVNDQEFFFHSSYYALWNEVGIIGLGLFMVLIILTLLSASGLPQAARNLWLEAGLVAVLTCAANLGEVLVELPTAVLLGAVLYHLGGRRAAPDLRPRSRQNIVRR